MATETIISVGIDLGTTTTQVIFSRLTIENVAGAASVPRIQIVDKKIIHQGEISFTPLLSPAIIDAEGVLSIVKREYEAAGLSPSSVSAGAVIITGETARKENSEKVLGTLSGLAGDFVVATAGSDLESILAARGAGASELSRQRMGKPIANLDIGGGTTNIAVFLDGHPTDTSCLDIGGRQIRVDERTGKILAVSSKIARLSSSMGIKLEAGKDADLKDLSMICDRLASIMAQSLGLREEEKGDLELFLTAHRLRKPWPLTALTYSGGVADLVYGEEKAPPFKYGDVGPILGESVKRSPELSKLEILTPKETIRATVVGAGSNALELSGSTITITHPDILPLKNLPILKLDPQDEADNFKYLSSRLSEKLSWYKESELGDYQPVAVALAGVRNPSFDQVRSLREKLLEGLDYYLEKNDLLVVIIEEDMAKSLGQSLRAALPRKKIVSLDSIKVENGDYIDIGVPVASGRVVPVVVKTLVFGR